MENLELEEELKLFLSDLICHGKISSCSSFNQFYLCDLYYRLKKDLEERKK